MPKGERGKRFLPGNPGGPGRPPTIPEAKDLPRMDRDSFNRLVNRIWNFSKDELKAVLDDPKATMIEKWIASVVAKGTTLGDMGRLEGLLARTVGPIKIEVNQVNEYTFSNTPKELIEIAVRMSTKARDIDVTATRSIGASAGSASEGG